MKNIQAIKLSKMIKKAACLLVAALFFAGCSDMISSDPNQLTSSDQYDLSAPGDSVYSTFGVLSQLQKIADAYVLLGELRGDLMDVSESSDMYLKQINEFKITSDNKYVNISDYYSVINNCNYIIQKLDTNVVDKGDKRQLRQYAVIKTIRAWTYLQIALNFKTVKYYTTPILTVEDANKQYPEYTLDGLLNFLIADLEPLKNTKLPNYGFIDTYYSSYSFLPVNFVLGDLYLWRGSLTDNTDDYRNAATCYYKVMYDYGAIINGATDKTTNNPLASSSVSYWEPISNTISNKAYLYWSKIFAVGNGEVMSTITCPTEYGQKFYLDSLNNQRQIIPSAIAINNWDSQTYFLNDASNTQGDLRKYGSISYSDATNSKAVTDYAFTGVTSNKYLIYKYKQYNQNVVIYRSGLLYLRFAEAVNRMQMPRTAFAVLKYGLNPTTLLNKSIIPQKEIGSQIPEFMKFNDYRFTNNVGIRMRGLGKMDKDTTFFVLRKKNSMIDSVKYVEDKIEQELALETAFEGNRYHDLMRFALRKIRNNEATESYLADKIAAKTNNADLRNRLMTIDNWYIKYK